MDDEVVICRVFPSKIVHTTGPYTQVAAFKKKPDKVILFFKSRVVDI